MRVIIRDNKTINLLNKTISISHDLINGNDYAVVSCSQRPNRKTYHSIDRNFVLYNKNLKLSTSFTTDAMLIWKELDFRYSLFNVQNAVNILKATDKDITISNVEKIL